MELQLKGRNALVCGSSQGIGLASAVELSKLGANVMLLARDRAKLEGAIAILDTSAGQQHSVFVADFSSNDSVLQAISEIRATGMPVHILVNNTGGPKGGNLIEAEGCVLLTTFQMHLINNHHLAQAFVPDMQAEGFGRIINVISTSVKQPITGLGVSNTIRWAVAAWAKTLANELGRFGITVNNVLPGYTKTARLKSVFEMRAREQGKTEDQVASELMATIPGRKFAEAADVGAAVAFLSTPAAGSINGINLPVDGGATASL